MGFNKKTHPIRHAVNFVFTNENINIPEHMLDISTLEITEEFVFYKSAMSIAIPESKLNYKHLESPVVTVMGYTNKTNKMPIREDEFNNPIVSATLGSFIDYPLIPDFDMSSIGCYPARQSAIHWPRQDTLKQMIGVPRGVSGAPVWSFTDPLDPNTGTVAGVFIKYFEKKSVAVFTNIQQVRAFIKHTRGI